jgi:hypothetical protein
MTTQTGALRLADELDKTLDFQNRAWAAATELRRLHTLTESANQDLWEICKNYGPVGELIFYKFKNRSKE